MAFSASISSKLFQSSAALAHHGKTNISPSPSQCCCSFSPLPPFSFPSKRIAFPQQGKMESSNSRILASVTDISVEQSMEEFQLPKGDLWSVHTFGGTCVGSSERIKNIAEIIINDGTDRKLVVVSAMLKVTDMMSNLIFKAQSRDDSYVSDVDAVFEEHRSTARDLLDREELAVFLSQLHHHIHSLKSMLQAVYIAGHATESFSDFVVGQGELWTAQMLAAVARKTGMDCQLMDTRDVLIVNPTSSSQVDPDFSESEKRLKSIEDSNCYWLYSQYPR